MMKSAAPGFATLAIHAGARPDATTGLDALGVGHTGAGHHPAIAALEERIAALEGGTAAVAAASGAAARLLALHALLAPGEDIVAGAGSLAHLPHAFANFGWRARWADHDDPSSFAAAIGPDTKAIFVESIAGPGSAITDLEAIARIAKTARIPLIVDNTLATPCLIRPFEHGADIVIHSAAKFLGGHGHAAGGFVIDGGGFDWLRDDRYPMLSAPSPERGGIVLGRTFGNFAFATACRILGLRDLGAALSPFDAFLILAGIETLPLRMQRHCQNAETVAAYLANHPAVRQARYPALEGDRNHALAKKYCPEGAGAVLAFALKEGHDAAALVGRLKLFSPFANAGDARSVAIHPASAAPFGEGATISAPDVVRLSIGLEDKCDLIADLDQALAA